MKKLVSIFAAATLLAATAASAVVSADEGEKLKLGIIPMDLSVEFFSSTVEGAQAFCDEHGYELIVVDGANDPSKQVQGLENCVAAGCQGVDFRALDPVSAEDAINEAVGKGIVVSTYPDIPGRSAVLLYDDYQRGVYLATEAAKWIDEKLGGEAEVAFLIEPKNDSAMKRIDAFNDVLTEKCPGAKIVGQAEGFTSDIAMSSTETLLQAHPDIKVILSSNDAGGLGAFEAVNSAGKASDDFFIGGIDGDITALNYIAQDTIYRCSVAPEELVSEQGYHAMENIANAILGNDYEEELVVKEYAITIDNVEAHLAKTPFFKD